MPYYVYIIEMLDKPRKIKIGVSSDVEGRLKTLQTGNPKPLRVIALFPRASSLSAFSFEKELHLKFADFRCEGEWFRWEVVDMLKAEALNGAPAAAQIRSSFLSKRAIRKQKGNKKPA